MPSSKDPKDRPKPAPLNVTPAAVEAAFIKANPNLSTESKAIECDKKRLTGVRISLSEELQFRSRAQIARRTCRREPPTMPRLC